MEIDVSAWTVIRDEPGGRDKNKRWIAEDPDAPRDQHWLWKYRQTTGDGSEAALTDCAEVFTSRLAAAIDLPAAECRFAILDGKPGLISRNVTPHGFNLNTGTTYLPEVEGYERRPSAGSDSDDGRMRLDEGYTLDSMERVLEHVASPPGVSDLSGFAVFAGYLVLDALVGNGDRHPGNWAILERQSDGARFLAPTFDHGSALGAGLTDDNRGDKDPLAFARRGRANPFSPRKQLLVDLALEAIRRSGADLWVARVAALDEVAIRETLEAPQGRLSEVASTFMEQVVLENQRRLCHGHATED
ncbi:HipA domain-containing protein [Nocardioides terrisoli]|uniref:hypothetical protein n=1 Tax=Nocardioides terrisoli TaxID=3388267 RepID=UPI00287B6871|nr:hypothetical protein [Nocardioides marmorisolisilvae]